MPNLVVYIPAGLWRELEVVAGDDAKNQARAAATAAIKSWIKEVALVERGASENEPVAVTVEPASAARGTEPRQDMAGSQEATRSRSTSASCSFDTPRGVKCKVCGQVHK